MADPTTMPTTTPLLPVQAVKWVMLAYALLAGLSEFLAKDAGPLAAYQWYVHLCVLLTGVLVAQASPGLHVALALVLYLFWSSPASARQAAVFESPRAASLLNGSPDASPFSPGAFLCVTRSGICQGASLNVNLLNLDAANGRFPLQLGVLVAQTEQAFLPGANLPLLTGTGALLGVGVVEQRGWLLSLFGGVVWQASRPGWLAGVAFHFLSPPAGGSTSGPHGQ